MPRLSVAITCPDEGHQFEDTLVSVLENSPGDCEIVVAYPGQYADPYDIRREVTVLDLPGCRSTAQLMNAALKASSADIIVYLRAGLRVTGRWWSPIESFDEDRCGAIAPLIAQPDQDHPLHMTGTIWRWHALACPVDGHCAQRLETPGHGHIVAPDLSFAWYRRSALLQAGGWDQRLPEIALTLDMAMAMKHLGLDGIVQRTTSVAGSPLAPARAGMFQQGRAWEHLFWKYGKNVGSLGKIQHASAVAGESIACFLRPRIALRLVGRLVTWLHLPLLAAETAVVADDPAAEGELDRRAA